MTAPLRIETWRGKRVDAMDAHELRHALREECRAHFVDIQALTARLDAAGYARVNEPAFPSHWVIDPVMKVAHFRPIPPDRIFLAGAVVVAACFIALLFGFGVLR